MESVPRAPSPQSFGLVTGTACGLLAAHAAWRGSVAAAWLFGAVAAGLLGCGWLAPRLLQFPSVLWMRLGHLLGWLNSRVLLTAMFFLVLTPMGLVLRLVGWDPLHLRRREGSGWSPYPPRFRDPKHYERMS